MACPCPRPRAPWAMGMVTAAPIRVDLTCPGISSGPSYVCSKNSSFHFSGTTWFSIDSSDLPSLPSLAALIVRDADVCLMQRLAVPTAHEGSTSPRAVATSAVISCNPRQGALTVIVTCLEMPEDGTTVATTSLACPVPYPPTSRCSLRYRPCHVPRSRDPWDTGTVTDAPTRVDLTCPGMSSSPSIVCSKRSRFHDSGQMWLNAASISVRTVGSAFSLIVRLAEVWRMKKFATPSWHVSMPLSAPSRVGVMRWHPRDLAFTVVLRVRGTSIPCRVTRRSREPRALPAHSHRYSPCHVPSARRPSWMGTSRETPTREVLEAAPSLVPPPSTMRSRALSRSVRTVGSAFSFIVRAPSGV
mmetsp:Transcript_47693/g.152881  ORF Transcript_47693/g.152881 Transcript_47693/m.152881 type:complete len:358 (+) Transcript_47693:127-1200(+)